LWQKGQFNSNYLPKINKNSKVHSIYYFFLFESLLFGRDLFFVYEASALFGINETSEGDPL
jgi:hypothetical protein